MAVDIEGIELNPALKELVGKVRSDDPYITGVRVGQYANKTVRLVLDLRQMVKPQVFNLQPVKTGNTHYQHRLVLDLYPSEVADPLEALIVDKLKGGTAYNAPSMTATPTPSASKLGTRADPVGDLMAKPNATPELPSPAASTASAPITTAASVNQQQDGERFIIVALDPGHGGEDPGASGPSGTREKDVVLKIAHRLRDRINNTVIKTKHGNLPMRAYLTRDADYFVPLQQRVEKARRVQADLFISIHALSLIHI